MGSGYGPVHRTAPDAALKAAGAFLTGKHSAGGDSSDLFRGGREIMMGSTLCRPLTVQDKNAEKTCVITRLRSKHIWRTAISDRRTREAKRFARPKPQQTKRRHIDTNGGE
jgi:hypothetical protein